MLNKCVGTEFLRNFSLETLTWLVLLLRSHLYLIAVCTK
jgi:hypothetical protein